MHWIAGLYKAIGRGGDAIDQHQQAAQETEGMNGIKKKVLF